MRIEDLRALDLRPGRDHLRLLTDDDMLDAEFDDHDSDPEPLAPEIMASLAVLREKLRAKLFAPNFGTRSNWSGTSRSR